MAAAVTFLAGTVALAEVPESARVRITDPAVLEAMGFPPDATNVYEALATRAPDVTEDFGTGDDYTPLGAKDFVGRQNTAGTPFQWTGGGEGCCANMSRSGSEQYADAEVHLPSGADVAFMRIWANDTDASNNLQVYLFEACHPTFSGGPTVYTTLGTGSTSGSSGNQSILSSVTNFTVDNLACHYTARTHWDTAGSTLTLQKVRFQWSRQVSPAPPTATFGDVPTGHSQFRFVEALVASGITGGCGGGNYCPNSPVTRGQMAVFLSSALGLSWP
jgi:hypothetical protein